MGARRLLLSFFSICSLTACSAAKFSTSKSDALSKNSVFGENESTGTIRQPGNPGDGRGTLRQPNTLDDIRKELLQGNTNEVSVTLVCSDRQSADATNLKRAIKNNMPVELKVGMTVCSTSAEQIKQLVLKPKISRADLQAICPAALPAADQPLALTVTINGKAETSSRGRLEVLYAHNKDQVAGESADENCDKNSSPLVIHVASDVNNPMPIALSSQETGVDFDLLGERAQHRKVRISWFTNEEYRFLALPNARGEVRGIDELFGDNTAGPDRSFADNGYAALAKYDGKSADGHLSLAPADGVIDERDPIFKKLRLWSDKNRDGIGQAHEMVSLRRAGITFIDLEFSSDYAEVDQYGNETKMKSVVGLRDGTLDLIFDLWFAYNQEVR